jgi:hypothetical protein
MPPGHQLPLPEWLEPTKEDVADAERTGRNPGLSVWDAELTSFHQACTWRGVNAAEELAFKAVVSNLRSVAASFQRDLDVVADPLDVELSEYLEVVLRVATSDRDALVASAKGHSLLEGVRRPSGLAKSEHRSFRDALAQAFSKH